MQIVIDIPDKIYNDLRSRREANVADINIVFGAISGGTVLPKGHGELIDRSKLKVADYCTMNDMPDFYWADEVNEAEIVIPADKENKE